MAAPRRRHAAGRPVLLVLLGVAAMLSALAGNAMANGQSIEGMHAVDALLSARRYA